MDPKSKCGKWYGYKNDMNEFIRIEDITDEQWIKLFTNLYGGVEENYVESNATDNNANRTEITQEKVNTRIKR